MKRNRILFAAAAALWMTSSFAWAQRPSSPQRPHNARFGNPAIFGMNYQDYFYGVISKIEPKALVLGKTKMGVPQTIRLSRNTKYIRNGHKSSLAKLKIGEMVYIDVKTNKKKGVMLARKVVSGMNVTVAP